MAKKKAVARSVTFDGDVEQLIDKHMKSQNLTNRSRVVNDGMKYALSPEFRDDRNEDMSKLYHQLLYSFNEHRKNTARDFAAIQEILLQSILENYKRMPAVDGGVDDAEAHKRLDALMEKVVMNMGKAKGMDESK